MKRLMTAGLMLLFTLASLANEQQFADMEWLTTSSGVAIENCRIGYRTAGELNDDRSNIIVFPTWFAGTSEILFTAGLIGPGKLADTDKYFVVAIDALGNGVSCSPSNAVQFPRISTEDMVRSQHWLLTEHLGIEHARAVLGISMGGMQTFRWMSTFPSFMDKAIPIDGSPKMTSFDLLQWRTHRDIVQMMQVGGMEQDEIRMILSRVGLLSLFTPEYFVEQVPVESLEEFVKDSDASYANMDVNDYVSQLEAMIDHDVIGDTDESITAYVREVESDVLIIGVPSDHMVNQAPSRRVARALGAPYFEVASNCGHVGTTCEIERVSKRVAEFLSIDQ
ncbi:MAG: alpha/beta fold hydrolase [Gammaproteobacteria bacterium]|nr:alpha/beta fold hydrolase [Gammaproteobacteria bacterium]